MEKKNSSKIGHNKKTLLNSPVEHIDIKSFDARKIIEVWVKCPSPRDTGAARSTTKWVNIFNIKVYFSRGCMSLPDLVKYNMTQ